MGAATLADSKSQDLIVLTSGYLPDTRRKSLVDLEGRLKTRVILAMSSCGRSWDGLNEQSRLFDEAASRGTVTLLEVLKVAASR